MRSGTLRIVNAATDSPQAQGPVLELSRTVTWKTQVLLHDHVLDSRTLPEELGLVRHDNAFVITDETVWSLYGGRLCERFLAKRIGLHCILVEPGEPGKDFATYAEVIDGLIAAGIDRKSTIIAFGGGSVCNLAGFVAATLFRGVRLIHIPTTFLAQVDACLDFKQAINHASAKNLVGAIYPADGVIIDPSLLATLSNRHLRNGIAEVLKHCLVQDAGMVARFLRTRPGRLDKALLSEIFDVGVALKVPLLSRSSGSDLDDLIPQYGHAIGHAIEHAAKPFLYHGESVAIGMCVCADIALEEGISDRATRDAHYALCAHFGLPTQVPSDTPVESIMAAMRHDKHCFGTPHMILLERIGRPASRDGCFGLAVSWQSISNALKRSQEHARKKR
jgi:3-dehydroquinate synthase